MSVFAFHGKIPGGFPYGITQTRGPDGTYLSGPGMSVLQRMKAKRAAKRAAKLGAIPTDFEMASLYNYTPVTSGWVAAQQGYITPTWNPTRGAPAGVPIQPNDGGGRPESPFALRFYTPAYARDPRWNTDGLADGTPATVEDVMAQMNAHNDRVFALTLVSTTAVAISAIITVFRTLRLIRKD